MYRLPSAARGSGSQAAGQSLVARDPSRPEGGAHLGGTDAQELLQSIGFLLVPGPPFDRGPAYLLVAVRTRPTLEHFDPERLVLWTSGTMAPEQIVLEWPLAQAAPSYEWGRIDVIDRFGAMNRFASFGGALNVAR